MAWGIPAPALKKPGEAVSAFGGVAGVFFCVSHQFGLLGHRMGLLLVFLLSQRTWLVCPFLVLREAISLLDIYCVFSCFVAKQRICRIRPTTNETHLAEGSLQQPRSIPIKYLPLD